MAILFEGSAVSNPALTVGWGRGGEYLISCKDSGFDLKSGTITITLKKKSNNTSVAIPLVLKTITTKPDAFTVKIPAGFEISASISGNSTTPVVTLFMDKL